MKLALAHDWLNQIGGAEDVLASLLEIWPRAPVYTSILAPQVLPPTLRTADLRPLWMNRLPAIQRHHQPYLPLYPLAWRGLDLSDHDVVLSNKSGFCHSLRHGGRALHICYCLAPTRYVWQLEAYIAREGLAPPLAAALRPLTALLRRLDFAAAQRVHHFIAISSEIRARIRKFYQRDAPVIFPPVETRRFRPAARHEGYFLVVSRLVPYKRIDLAVRAASQLGLPLIVAGRGRDLERLQELAGPTVEFPGFVPDAELPALMAGCRALLFPGHEDFGITPLQAQAAGRPVIACGSGGALDTVIPGLGGELFPEQTVEALAAALANFDESRYDSAAMRAHALRFDVRHFRRRISAFVDQAWTAWRQGRTFVWRDPGED